MRKCYRIKQIRLVEQARNSLMHEGHIEFNQGRSPWERIRNCKELKYKTDSMNKPINHIFPKDIFISTN